jgi:predicted nucleotidyltransferase
MNRANKVEETIQKVVERVVRQFAPDRIILFGSHAHGQPTADSDLDFLVIMDVTLGPLERVARLTESVAPLELPVDIFAMTPEEFEETEDVIGGLAYAPAKYGRVVYEKP